MFMVVGFVVDNVLNDFMVGEGFVFRDWGSVLGSLYFCNFFFIKCIVMENFFLFIFLSLFIFVSCLLKIK